MNHPTVPARPSRAGLAVRAGLPALCLAVVVGKLVPDTEQPQVLQASTHSLLGPDYDQDGLADAMELVLGTSPDVADTDLDSIHDLEELARGSDPLDANSTPADEDLQLGMFAYTENGVLALHTAIYVKDGQLGSLSFELGVVLNGQPLTVAQQTYTSGTLAFLYPDTENPDATLMVLEMPVPEWIVKKLGDVSVYTAVQDHAAGTSASVDVLNLTVMGDTVMQLTEAPPSIAAQKGGGVVYRPLSGDGATPTDSVPGQICWQELAPAGTNGASIQYEVERASCADFDSYCVQSDCAAKVGSTVSLPDPGRILGG